MMTFVKFGVLFSTFLVTVMAVPECQKLVVRGHREAEGVYHHSNRETGDRIQMRPDWERDDDTLLYYHGGRPIGHWRLQTKNRVFQTMKATRGTRPDGHMEFNHISKDKKSVGRTFLTIRCVDNDPVLEKVVLQLVRERIESDMRGVLKANRRLESAEEEADYEELQPGKYVITNLSGAVVREGKELTSTRIRSLLHGEAVAIVEIARTSERVRGRLEEGGWISLRDPSDGHVFAETVYRPDGTQPWDGIGEGTRPNIARPEGTKTWPSSGSGGLSYAGSGGLGATGSGGFDGDFTAQLCENFSHAQDRKGCMEERDADTRVRMCRWDDLFGCAPCGDNCFDVTSALLGLKIDIPEPEFKVGDFKSATAQSFPPEMGITEHHVIVTSINGKPLHSKPDTSGSMEKPIEEDSQQSQLKKLDHEGRRLLDQVVIDGKPVDGVLVLYKIALTTALNQAQLDAKVVEAIAHTLNFIHSMEAILSGSQHREVVVEVADKPEHKQPEDPMPPAVGKPEDKPRRNAEGQPTFKDKPIGSEPTKLGTIEGTGGQEKLAGGEGKTSEANTLGQPTAGDFPMGAIIGVMVGCAVIMGGVGAYCCLTRRRKRRKRKSTSMLGPRHSLPVPLHTNGMPYNIHNVNGLSDDSDFDDHVSLGIDSCRTCGGTGAVTYLSPKARKFRKQQGGGDLRPHFLSPRGEDSLSAAGPELGGGGELSSAGINSVRHADASTFGSRQEGQIEEGRFKYPHIGQSAILVKDYSQASMI